MRLLFLKALLKTGSYDRALAVVGEWDAQSLRGQHELIYVMAQVYFLSNQYTQCAKTLLPYQDQPPKDEMQAQALFLLAQCLDHIGQLERAIQVMTQLEDSTSLIDPKLIQLKKRFLTQRYQQKEK